VALSEDVAQETFLAAWRDLGQLREPEKLKSWLCGIARNIVRASQRKHRSNYRASAANSDAATEAVSRDATPHDEAITREEATIVGRALETLPESFREPLVLFYREDQSVRHVAHALDLSEDVVKQRLSRGRKMLRGQLLALIEESLRRTKPGAALTIAIVSSLPSASAHAKAIGLAGAAVKGLPAAKAAFGGTALCALASPLITLAATPLAAMYVKRTIKPPRERHFLVRFTWIIGLVNVIAAIIISYLSFKPDFIVTHPVLFGITLVGTILVNVVMILGLSFWADGRLKRLRAEDQQ
jgi:RNA polymerase sigma factor (sigma-70 family)